nr:MBL fold metallo-hydrolase [Candidatus Sigynarchaeota archaeon]
MPTPSKLTTHVFMVGSGQLSGINDCCVYAIFLQNKDVCLIDTGTSNGGAIMNNLKQAGFAGKISHIVITHSHFDHVGAAWQFKNIFKEAKIIAHKLDADAIEGAKGTEGRTAASFYHETYKPVKVDVMLTKDSEDMTLGGTKITFLHTPGHTPGSISAVVVDDGKKVLFGQDVHGPFMDEFKSSIQDWAKSMKMLLGLNADILCEGHFGAYQGKDKVKEFITSHLKENNF